MTVGAGKGVFVGIWVGGTDVAVAVGVGVAVDVGMGFSVAVDDGGSVTTAMATFVAVSVGGAGVKVSTIITIEFDSDFGTSEDCNKFCPTRAKTRVANTKIINPIRIIISQGLRFFLVIGTTGLVFSLKNDGSSLLCCASAHSNPF